MYKTKESLTAACLLLSLPSLALANGTEALGTPTGINNATGSDYILVGAGLADTGSGQVTPAIPQGGTVVQVLAYWDGLALTPDLPSSTDSLLLNGVEVTGQRIGGPSNFIGPYNSFAYRADVTDLNLIGPDSNAVTATGLDFAFRNNGFGLLIILDDGTSTETVGLRDGSDFAYGDFAAPYDTTAPQTFTFPASDQARTAEVGLFVSGVEESRPSVIEVTVGETVTRHIDVLGGHSGAQWDALELNLAIPAGETSAQVRILSEDAGTGQAAGNQIASLNWVAAAFSIEAATDSQQYGCTPQFWSCNWWRWDSWCTSDNNPSSIVLTDRFNATMGVHRFRSGVGKRRKLWNALNGWSWRGWHRTLLNRHAVAALLNADSGINYPYTVEQVKALYRDAVGQDSGPETVYSVLCKFYTANQLGCPW